MIELFYYCLSCVRVRGSETTEPPESAGRFRFAIPLVANRDDETQQVVENHIRSHTHTQTHTENTYSHSFINLQALNTRSQKYSLTQKISQAHTYAYSHVCMHLTSTNMHPLELVHQDSAIMSVFSDPLSLMTSCLREQTQDQTFGHEAQNWSQPTELKHMLTTLHNP